MAVVNCVSLVSLLCCLRCIVEYTRTGIILRVQSLTEIRIVLRPEEALQIISHELLDTYVVVSAKAKFMFRTVLVTSRISSRRVVLTTVTTVAPP